MSTVNSYALGNGKKAFERLNLQHAILRKDFENHLLESGLKKDMVVLDIGCGNGLMTSWIASQVGENGRVIAVDRSHEPLAIAKKQALAKGITNIEFICSDVRDLELTLSSIDFVCCRFLLMHLPDPLMVIKKALLLLKDGGVFAAQEPINSATYLYPEDRFFIEKLRKYLQNISTRFGVDYDIGGKLHTLFYTAGYHPIDLHFSQRVVPISGMKDLLFRFFEDIGPRALKAKAISQKELIALLTSIQTYPEKDDSYYVIPKQAHISAYKQ
jgi:ubiquinone/menaquinone biosynthesis C-methylase UbiE